MRTIIFSKDRACQLYALLESIGHFDNEKKFNPLVVIYDSSSAEYDTGYRIVQTHFSSVQFVKQSVFKADVMDQLTRARSEVMFLVDDQIMRYPMLFDWEEVPTLFYQNGNVGSISLRLGNNTTTQYQSGQTIQPPKLSGVGGAFRIWNSFPHPTTSNWGYPLSVDGHIFRTADIRGILARLSFDAPNTMEEQMSLQKSYFSPIMACQDESVFVNNPINLVQTTHNNRYSGEKNLCAETMNDMFVYERFKIDWEEMIFANEIVGSHQDLVVRMTDR